MRAASAWALSGLLLAALQLPGCGSANEVQTVEVSGTVDLDGMPIETGYVSFFPADGKGATAGVPVTNGAFKGPVPPGDKKVQINAPRKTGQRKAYDTPDSPMIDVVEEQVPARYNVNTELKADIKNGENAPLKFSLTGDKKKK